MTVRAEIKRLYSPHVADLLNYRPTDPTNFGFLLQLIAGPVGEEGFRLTTVRIGKETVEAYEKVMEVHQ
jgi:hypothetical protein